MRYLQILPAGIVAYVHLAGHAVLADVLIDTHDANVPAQVWELFAAAARRFPDAGVIVERDDHLPPFDRLVAEVEAARFRYQAARREPPLAPAEQAEGVVPLSAPAPPPWRALQHEFWSRLVGAGADDGACGVAFLDPGRPVRAERGMRVYRDAYAVSLRRALAANFPALACVVSGGDFARLTAAYLREHPPIAFDFRSLGRGLASFIGSHRFADDYGVEPGVLAEIAALEQAQLEVLDEIDEGPGVDGESLAAIAPEEWEDVRLRLVRALRIVRAAHDVLPVVEAVGRGESPARPPAANVAYLVHRSGAEVHTARLGERQAGVIEALVAGETFAAACRRAGIDTEEGEMVMEAARALITACSLGLVLEVRTAG
jgi:hypothetical protein